MKKILVIFVACAAGTFCALQLNTFLEKRAAIDQISKSSSSSMLLTGEPAQAAAPGVAPVPDFRAAAKKVLQSVVSIETRGTIRRWMTTETTDLGQGSGVVITDSGYIVTNNHVVRNPQSGQTAEEVRVHLPNQQVVKAKVVGIDERTDLAVLKVDGQKLVPVELGDNRQLEIGEWVIAAGNPLGFDNTVSVGVVSSLNRQVDLGRGNGQFVLLNAIQTDAAINPGNSGGALVNARGQLVGINSAIASQTGNSIGIGFAIPVDRVRRITNDIIKFGHARHGQLGVQTYMRPGLLADDDARAELSQLAGATPPDYGLIVQEVIPTSPAGRLGISQFCVLLQINGSKLNDSIEFYKALADKVPGDKVELTYWKKGQIYKKTVELADLTDI
jgi:putative serine protease PepD